MAKQDSRTLHFLAWFTGVVVSLAVGFGLIKATLVLPTWLGGATNIGSWLTIAIGWVVVITTLISAILAIIRE
ncbi:MAG: hypothetical protein Q7S56_00145 [Nanoarchaeota archaeon]|nr:hypothetical protein [Nanoarchaeota archaeon]